MTVSRTRRGRGVIRRSSADPHPSGMGSPRPALHSPQTGRGTFATDGRRGGGTRVWSNRSGLAPWLGQTRLAFLSAVSLEINHQPFWRTVPAYEDNYCFLPASAV